MEWVFLGNGVAATRFRAIDWRGTPVGVPDAWPAPVRAAIQVCLAIPTPALVAWRELAFANDACGALDPLAGAPPGLRPQLAALFAERAWLAAGSAPLEGFGVALPIVDDDGALLAVAAVEDRQTLAHRLREHLGPMLMMIELLRRAAPGDQVDALEHHVRALAAALAGDEPVVPPEPRPAVGRPQRILVVEDDNAMALTLRDMLTAMGHVVELAHDGAVAVAVARAFSPEVVFVDIGLPVIDGWEVSSRLRQLALPGLRFVAVTGRGNEADRARSIEAGFVEHVVKPVDAAQLMRIVGPAA